MVSFSYTWSTRQIKNRNIKKSIGFKSGELALFFHIYIQPLSIRELHQLNVWRLHLVVATFPNVSFSNRRGCTFCIEIHQYAQGLQKVPQTIINYVDP